MRINNITKRYGRHLVLDNVTSDIPDSGVVGLLGLNGSGKTTLLNAIVGLISCDACDVDVKSNLISYFPDKDHFLNLTVKEFLRTIELSYDDFDKDKCMDMLKTKDINERIRIKKLTRGQKVLLNISITLSRETDYYFLDEPFSNIDFEMREFIMDKIVEYGDIDKKTIIISSHQIDDIERIIDYVLVVHNKKLIELRTLPDILEESKQSLISWFTDYITDLEDKIL